MSDFQILLIFFFFFEGGGDLFEVSQVQRRDKGLREPKGKA